MVILSDLLLAGGTWGSSVQETFAACLLAGEIPIPSTFHRFVRKWKKISVKHPMYLFSNPRFKSVVPPLCLLTCVSRLLLEVCHTYLSLEGWIFLRLTRLRRSVAKIGDFWSGQPCHCCEGEPLLFAFTVTIYKFTNPFNQPTNQYEWWTRLNGSELHIYGDNSLLFHC